MNETIDYFEGYLLGHSKLLLATKNDFSLFRP